MSFKSPKILAVPEPTALNSRSEKKKKRSLAAENNPCRLTILISNPGSLGIFFSRSAATEGTACRDWPAALLYRLNLVTRSHEPPVGWLIKDWMHTSMGGLCATHAHRFSSNSRNSGSSSSSSRSRRSSSSSTTTSTSSYSSSSSSSTNNNIRCSVCATSSSSRSSSGSRSSSKRSSCGKRRSTSSSNTGSSWSSSKTTPLEKDNKQTTFSVTLQPLKLCVDFTTTRLQLANLSSWCEKHQPSL